MTSSFSRLAAGATVLAAALGTLASPAHAAEAGEARASNTNITVKSSRGYMIFHDDGDMFSICDTNADGHGVEGQLVDYYTGTTYLYIDDGGDSGCDKKGYDISSGTHYVMQFWWSGDGVVRKSARFQE
ncbi:MULTISPECIES: hypothetical protein [unclassified Streptomyces]|uniref:hypothetical protein n=1 Tax=unclassified Streptomyces TaxID=2593676 RepID=UPI001587AFD3|nr:MULTISPECIES: hypothetical protein [unclassified Streptomyces]NUV71420.1 hypothetical protein [Streptomyces sp. CAI-121]NUW02744.1 hypothetical protein [Streptomyces sp. CAI 127]NUW17591.1 hypothetical protein [Streptomyces sp. CAI-68]